MDASVFPIPLPTVAKSPPRTSPTSFPLKRFSKILYLSKTPSKINVSSKTSTSSSPPASATATSDDSDTAISTGNNKKEMIFFDGGAHYGDLVINLILGFTLVWLPLTIAAVSRAFFLRYRFTSRRVTVISGFTGQDRSDFPYSVIKDVQVVPRLIGEWGDIVITLKDGTKVDIRSVPRFRMVADYCLLMADGFAKPSPQGSRGF